MSIVNLISFIKMLLLIIVSGIVKLDEI